MIKKKKKKIEKVRVTMRARENTGWIGLVFGFLDTRTHFRYIMRISDSCHAIQRRVNSSDDFVTYVTGSMIGSF